MNPNVLSICPCACRTAPLKSVVSASLWGGGGGGGECKIPFQHVPQQLSWATINLMFETPVLPFVFPLSVLHFFFFFYFEDGSLPVITQRWIETVWNISLPANVNTSFFSLCAFSPLVFFNPPPFFFVMLGLVLTVLCASAVQVFQKMKTGLGAPWGVAGNPGNEKSGSGERRHSESHGWLYCSDPTFGVTADRVRCLGPDSFEGDVKEF